jgi:hypothetical protein
LADGTRLRLRLPRRRDRDGVRVLLARLGVEAEEAALARALLFDPSERVAIVATRLIGRCEEVVGVAAMDRYAREPELVLADEREAPGTMGALESALRAHRR